MSVTLSPYPIFRGVANDGTALVGGQLFTYIAGTTTPQATYVDATQTTPNTNPVILNARGEANVWVNQALTYKYVLQDAQGNPIWTQDQITASVNVGALLYPIIPAEVGLSPAPSVLTEPYGFVTRYGADATGATPSDTAFANAVTVCGAVGYPMRIRAGTYLLNGPSVAWPVGVAFLNVSPPWAFDIVGDGADQTIIKAPNFTTGFTATGVIGNPHFCGAMRGVYIYGGTTATGLVTFTACLFPRIIDCIFRSVNGYAVKYANCIMGRIETSFISAAGNATQACLVITGSNAQVGTTFCWDQSYISNANPSCVNGVSVDFHSSTYFDGGAVESCGIPFKIGCQADNSVGTIGGHIIGVDMEQPVPGTSYGTAGWYVEFGTGQSASAVTSAWRVADCTCVAGLGTNVLGFIINNNSSVSFGVNYVVTTLNQQIHALSTAAATAGVHVDANPAMYNVAPWVTVNGIQVKQASPLVAYDSRNQVQLPWEQELTLTGTTGSILISADGGYYKNVVCLNAGPVTLATLTDGVTNQLMYMRDVNGNTTLQGGGGANAFFIKSAFNTWGAANLPMLAGVTYCFRHNGTSWVQI